MGADPLQANLHRLLDGGGFVRSHRDRLQELDEARLLVQSDLGLLALRDVAPRAHDLERRSAFVADEPHLVGHPTVGPVLAAKAVFVDEPAAFEQPREVVHQAGQIVGMHPLQPEIGILQVFPGS